MMLQHTPTHRAIQFIVVFLVLVGRIPTQAQLQWERISEGLSTRPIASIVCDSTGYILALNNGGAFGVGILFRWEPDSSRWRQVMGDVSLSEPFEGTSNKLSTNRAGSFLMTAKEITLQEGPVEYKSTDYKAWRSTDGGATWNRTGGILYDIATNDNGVIALALASNYHNHFAYGVQSGAVLLSTDNGATWTAPTIDAPALRNIAITPSGTIFTSGLDQSDAPGPSAILRSTDLGATWSRLEESLGLSPESSTLFGPIAATSDGTIFATLDRTWSGHTIVRSTDNGESWKLVFNKHILVDRFVIPSPDVVFVEYGHDWEQRSLRSTDNGDTWNDVPNSIHDLLIAYDGALYGLGDGVIYRSTDLGETWTPLSEELPVAATCFTVAPSGYIYGGTQSNGVYRSTRSLAVHTPSTSDAVLSLGQLRTQSIAFTLPHSGRATLIVYDLLGRPIATLLDDWMPEGRNQASIDDRLSSGAFLFVLSTENERTSRMVILQ